MLGLDQLKAANKYPESFRKGREIMKQDQVQLRFQAILDHFGPKVTLAALNAALKVKSHEDHTRYNTISEAIRDTVEALNEEGVLDHHG